jgi:hypothetical protein
MIQATGTSTSAESINFEGTEYFAQLYEKSNSSSMTCIFNMLRTTSIADKNFNGTQSSLVYL